MTYKTKKKTEEDIIKQQMIDIAWHLVKMLDSLTTNLWSIFADEFNDRINQDREKEIPF